MRHVCAVSFCRLRLLLEGSCGTLSSLPVVLYVPCNHLIFSDPSKAKMSVAGFDLGDQSSCVAVARKKGIDVLLNKESNRETPSVLTFNNKARLLGTDALGSLAVNPKNAVSQVKRLLGKKFSAPSVQADIKNLLFEVTQGPNDSILVALDYLGERKHFTPEQLMAMLIVDGKAIALTDNSPVTDCVIAVPSYFTMVERRAMLDASQIAGVQCLRLMQEITATALAFGIYKTDLPEKDPLNVVFVDVGYSSLQVAVVAFKKGQLKILSLAWDRDLGGRNFDEVLFDHFTQEFQEKYKIDVRANKKSSFRLRLAVEKLKKVLSSIPETMLNVESLMNDLDVSSKLTREIFEEKSKSILERVKKPLETALAQSGIKKEALSSVEIVGSSSRVPALLQLVREVYGIEPSRTLNAKECVSKGCALSCAMLSPIFRVRDFEVIDIFPYGVQLSWEKDGKPTTSVVFEKNGPMPSTKSLTFFRSEAFQLHASYTEDSDIPSGMDKNIATWTIGAPKPTKNGAVPKLKIRLTLSLHGLVTLDSVTQVEEEEYEEIIKRPVPAKAQETKKEDEPMSDANDKAVPENDGADGAPELNATPMETDTTPGEAKEPEPEVVKKKRTLKENVPFEVGTFGYSTKELNELYEKECEMALQDKIQEETSERKNALEAYIYSLRNKLCDRLAEYVTSEEKADLNQKLEAAEDWLYDEGEDETKSVYSQKLEELLRLGSPVEQREKEAQARPAASQALEAAAQHYISLATSEDPKFAHIPGDERNKIIEEANNALKWLQEKSSAQSKLKRTDAPLLLSTDIKKKQDVLARVSEPILSKPAPAPKKEEPKQAKDEKMGEDENAKEAEPSAEGPQPDSSEPMEQ